MNQEHLIIYSGHQEISRQPLSEFFTIGSGEGNDLVLNTDKAATKHCRIEKKQDGYYLRDLRTGLNTLLNGKKVDLVKLTHFDQIQLGRYRLRFSIRALPLRDHLNSKSLEQKDHFHKVPQAAGSTYPILLSGESGTGKDVLAREIHSLSARDENIYMTLNCGALSESLVESELFGHRKGSFTGAYEDRKGAFETASGGTLFLDEIGELSLGLQAKLLRAIENQEIRPIGSDTNIKINVRIIAATHKDLKRAVVEGNFRLDLFYRLNVIEIKLLPLRQRIDDLPHFAQKFGKESGVKFSHCALLELKKHTWPGNIRELKNFVARASIQFPGERIMACHVQDLIDKVEPQPINYPSHKQPIIRQIEKDLIIERLKINGGNQRKTAEDLKMPKSTLHDRIRTYEINVRQFKIN